MILNRRIYVLIIVLMVFLCNNSFAGEEGLTAYYDFETEEAVDMSGNGLDGSVIGGAPDLIDGAVGKAWFFNGAIRIEMDYQQFKDPKAELSMRCFIKPEDPQGQQIIYEEGGAWTGYCVRIMDGELEFGVVCCGQNHPPYVSVSTELPDTEDWMEIVTVFDNGKISLYVDGVKVSEENTEWAELGAHGQSGGIGEKQSGDTAFNEGSGFYIGGIDELKVYSRVLALDEISMSVSALSKLTTTWGNIKLYE